MVQHFALWEVHALFRQQSRGGGGRMVAEEVLSNGAKQECWFMCSVAKVKEKQDKIKIRGVFLELSPAAWLLCSARCLSQVSAGSSRNVQQWWSCVFNYVWSELSEVTERFGKEADIGLQRDTQQQWLIFGMWQPHSLPVCCTTWRKACDTVINLSWD